MKFLAKSAFLKNLRLYSLPLLSGILMGFSYIPFYPRAVFFCWIPLWLFALTRERLKTVLIGAWLCQFIVSLIGFSWLAYTIKEFMFPSWLGGLFWFLVFTSFANLHIPVSLLFWRLSLKLIKRRAASGAEEGEMSFSSRLSPLALLLLPLYAALSFEYFPMIFKWHFGYVWLYAEWPAAQTAEIWGFRFLNTITLFFNLLFLLAFQRFRLGLSCGGLKSGLKSMLLSGRRALTPLILWVLIFFSLNLFGIWLKSRWPDPDRKARALILQPNISNQAQKDEIYSAGILKQILQDTQSALSSSAAFSGGESLISKKAADFILWPEGAYPYPINKDLARRGEDPIQKQPPLFRAPLMVSAMGERLHQQTSNSVFAFDQNGRLAQGPYDKVRLLPFGEYTPLGKHLPFLNWFFLGSEPFASGTGENRVIRLSGIRFGIQICYESLSDKHSRQAALEGANALVNFTNDSWFGFWQEPWQHLYITLSRAIEIRRPLLRGTNSGFSAVISAKGDISSPAPLNREALGKKLAWIAEFPYEESPRQTLFASWGFYISQGVLWALLILIYLPAALKGLRERLGRKSRGGAKSGAIQKNKRTAD